MSLTGDNGHWIRAAVARHEHQLMLYATHLLGSSERAGDAVQETFCRLCRMEESRVADHLAEWLYTVCRNIVTDMMRKDGRMKAFNAEAAVAPPLRSAPTPMDEAEQRDDEQRMLAALSTLPERQQELVRLKFQHGLSYKQIAEVTQLSVSNVGFILHTAIRTLREQLNETDTASGLRGRGVQS